MKHHMIVINMALADYGISNGIMKRIHSRSKNGIIQILEGCAACAATFRTESRGSYYLGTTSGGGEVYRI